MTKKNILLNYLTRTNALNFSSFVKAFEGDLDLIVAKYSEKFSLFGRELEVKNLLLEKIFDEKLLSKFSIAKNFGDLEVNFIRFMCGVLKNISRSLRFKDIRHNKRYFSLEDGNEYRNYSVKNRDIDLSDSLDLLSFLRSQISEDQIRDFDILIDKELKNLSQKELSLKYKINPKTIGVKIFRIKGKLKEILKYKEVA